MLTDISTVLEALGIQGADASTQQTEICKGFRTTNLVKVRIITCMCNICNIGDFGEIHVLIALMYN